MFLVGQGRPSFLCATTHRLPPRNIYFTKLKNIKFFQPREAVVFI
nr:MAG TPA: EB1-like C-terminal motif [Bacteriophage sp.]